MTTTVTTQATIISDLGQQSTNSFAIVQGSLINMTRYSTLSYTFHNSGANALDWKVVGGNTSDLTDGVDIDTGTLASDAYDSHTSQVTPYQWYAVFIKADVADSQSTLDVNGIGKRGW